MLPTCANGSLARVPLVPAHAAQQITFSSTGYKPFTHNIDFMKYFHKALEYEMVLSHYRYFGTHQ